MNDLISRQAAIDTIERNAYRHTYLDQIVDIIRGLPSAQPERKKIDYNSIILVQYIVYGLHDVPTPDDMRIRDRRFVAETEEEVKAGIRQLYADICERYPLEEFPNRHIHVDGVFREIACDMVGTIEEGEENER